MTDESQGPPAGRAPVPRPFRFIAPMPRFAGSLRAWGDELRRIEDLGYDSVSVSEHLGEGWQLDAPAAMLAIAAVTERIRILSLVLSNDLRPPAMLHKSAATIDVFSGGRLELGVGTGWLAEDAAAVGLDAPGGGARVERLAETVEIVDRLFTSPDPVTFHGRHYRVDGLVGLPLPVQRPRPPILVGGGGPKVLELAARRADIVGIHCRLPGGTLARAAIDEFGAASLDAKVRHVRASARAADRDPSELELQFTAYVTHIGPGEPTPGSALGRRILDEPAVAADSPAVVVGSIDACVERLLAARERFGFSYWKLSADPGVTAPIVARLRGR